MRRLAVLVGEGPVPPTRLGHGPTRCSAGVDAGAGADADADAEFSTTSATASPPTSNTDKSTKCVALPHRKQSMKYSCDSPCLTLNV